MATITTSKKARDENSDREGIAERTVDGVRVQRVDPRMLDGVSETGYSWCNTCNHRDTEAYEKNQQTFGNNDWYQQIMARTRMEKWQSALGHLVRQPELVLTISAEQQKKYFDTQLCKNIAFRGVRAKTLLGDEAEDLAKELRKFSGLPLAPLNSNGWFVRTSACSTKDSQDDGGAGPHGTLEDALLALFASERVHVSMKDYTKDVKVYLVPFDSDVTVARELRVFVHKHQVTAISQYDVFNDSIFSTMSDVQLAELANLVRIFHCENVKNSWTKSGGIDSYVMDVEYDLDKGDIRLIELNSFGAEMAAASALFHWVQDASEVTPLELRGICIRVRSEGS